MFEFNWEVFRNGFIVLAISILCGIKCIHTLNKDFDEKFNQKSWEYQIFGYLFANIAVFGSISGIGLMGQCVVSYIHYLVTGVVIGP